MIDSERMQTLIKEITLGKTPQPANQEETEFIEKVKTEISRELPKGAMIEFPGDW